jgi:hypothetical protein
MTHRHTPKEHKIQWRRCYIIRHPFVQYRCYMLRSEGRYLRTHMGTPIRTHRRSRGITLKCMLKKRCVRWGLDSTGAGQDKQRILVNTAIYSYTIKCEEFHDQLNVQYYDSTSRSCRLCTEHIPSTSLLHCLISYHPHPFFYLLSSRKF